MPKTSVYHNVDLAGHAANSEKLAKAGYHPASLCVYGDAAAPSYAAVWVQESWPSWVQFPGGTYADYQSWMTNVVAPGGYALRLLTVTGSAADAVFAAVAEKTGAAITVDATLTDATLKTFITNQQLAGSVPTSIAPYGDPSNRLYAVVSQNDQRPVQWDYTGVLTAEQWQLSFNAYAEANLRPGLISVTSDGLYLGVFRNDSLGGQITRHGLNVFDVDSVLDSQPDGFYPIWLAAGNGAGITTRFAATFATRTTPAAQAITITGTPEPKLAHIDTMMQGFMQSFAVRAAQVAVMHDGELVYSRAFTWGQPGYPVTQPTTLMRIASCSKAFTAAAINALITAAALSLDDRVYPKIGITAPALPNDQPDPRINYATVQDFLNHLGGWNDGGSSGTVYVKNASGGYDQVPAVNDPAFEMRVIAQALGLAGLPTKRDVAAYMYGQPLQFTPGTPVYTQTSPGVYKLSETGAYSNFGYFLLGVLIEAVSGQTYFDYLRSAVLAPAGLTDEVAVSWEGSPVPGEVSYDDPRIGLAPSQPNADVLIPYVEGGDGLVTEIFDAPSGLMTSAQSLADFIHTHAVWGIGGRVVSTRSGSESGSSSLAQSRQDGVDWAYIINTRWMVDSRTVGAPNITALDYVYDSITSVLNGVSW